MPEVCFASPAGDRDALQAQAVVGEFYDIFLGDGLPETWPACAPWEWPCSPARSPVIFGWDTGILRRLSLAGTSGLEQRLVDRLAC
jgi:hypothetical protein